VADEHALEAEMVRIANEAKANGYNPSYFVRMIHELGGLATAQKLISSDAPSEGFVRLWELNRLDLTVEALALKPEYRALFSASEVLAARKRLSDYGFQNCPARGTGHRL
jgi:hypothetical protein